MRVGTRYSIQELSSNVELQPEFEKVIRAFAGIQALPPSNPNSYYHLATFHGEPFRGPVTAYPGAGTWIGNDNVAQTLWWGGYCNHNNILFPTWHRAYMHRFEKALQSIKGCEDVRLPFWDECSEMGNWDPYKPPSNDPPAAPQVVPKIFTDEYIILDGEWIKNPLHSYTLQRDTQFSADEELNNRYSKPKGYETRRFPERGVMCNKKERAISAEWNKKFGSRGECNKILNANLAQWLEGSIQVEHNIMDPVTGKPTPPNTDTMSVYSRFQLSLEAPNYTVFACTPAQDQWIMDMKEQATADQFRDIVSVESPHNSVHLAVGGFFQVGQYMVNPKEYRLANGDFSTNEYASFDPIFYFHHAFIDYVFWLWQKKNGLTKRGDLDVLEDYPGTVTDQGSPVGLAPGSVLDMDTPLYPFRTSNKKGWVTSHAVTDIRELGYDYGRGSLDAFIYPSHNMYTNTPIRTMRSPINDRVVAVKRTRGINRAGIEGSFVIRTIAKYGDRRIEVGREPILSRFNVRNCANCQSHLDTQSLFPIYRSVVEALGAVCEAQLEYEVQLDTRETTYCVPPGTTLAMAYPIFGPGSSDGALAKSRSVVRVETI